MTKARAAAIAHTLNFASGSKSTIAPSLLAAPLGSDGPNVPINRHHTKSQVLRAFALSGAHVRPKKPFHSV